MMRFILPVVTCLTVIMLTGCPADQENDGERSSIEQATKKVADAAVDYIEVPKEKAQAVKEIEEARQRRLEEQTGNP